MARPLSDTARAEMIRAAREIVTIEGVNACTLDEVARRSGVAKTTIYRHFGGVDGLVLAVVDDMVQATEAPDTGTLEGDLRIIVGRYLTVAAQPSMRELYGWMMTRSMEDPGFASRFRSVRVQGSGPTVLALQRAIARGEVPATIDIPLAMHLIQGPLATKRIVDGDTVTDVEFDTLLTWIVGALRSAG